MANCSACTANCSWFSMRSCVGPLTDSARMSNSIQHVGIN
jgi:hypothetical protein